jgi:hypothetical protein
MIIHNFRVIIDEKLKISASLQDYYQIILLNTINTVVFLKQKVVRLVIVMFCCSIPKTL